MMPNTLDNLELKPESAPGPNSLVANLNELSSMNDFNKDFKNKPALRAGNKTPFFYPNPAAHIPFFPNQQSPNYQYFNPYQMSAKNFYSLSMFSKPTYQDKRSYLKVKKEQNMHKLWPHSVHTKPDTPDQEPVISQINAEQDSSHANSTNEATNSELNKKTPMCLIHELVKFNKIKHEYILLDEKGPAHKKTFYVQLKLGAGTSEEESYEANGSSIKKAQHKAAEMALNETRYAKPSPRVKPEPDSRKIIPTFKKDNEAKQAQSNTVRLNSLCMKHGLKANYEHISTPVSHSIYTNFNSNDIKPFVYQPAQVYAPNFGFNRAFSFGKKSSRAQRYTRFGADGISKVKLKIGNEEFVAEGESVQKARHSAAALALDFMSNEENFRKIKEYFNKKIEDGETQEHNEQNKVDSALNGDADSKVTILSRTKSEPEKSDKKDTVLDNLSRTKSEISILLEFSLRFNKPLSFELVNESGPSHIKKFVTKCSMGSPNDQLFEVLGEGNSKKQSKQKSAVEMLKIISDQHPQSLESLFCKKETAKKTDSKNVSADRKKRKSKSNIIVANKTSPEYGSGTINPITRLIQIQQAKKQPEPLFELVSSVNRYKKSDVTKSRSEFCMSVSVLDSSGGELVKCEAKGPNKKVAKQNAAEAMLAKLGYPSVSAQQTHIKPVLKSSEENGEKSDKKVKFIEPNEHGDQERSSQEHKDIIKIKSTVTNKIKLYKDQLNDRACEVNVLLDKSEFGVCAAISKELLESIEKNDRDFYSQSAEDYLSQRELGSSVISAKDFNETEQGRAKLKILTNGSEGNFKAALDYLANIFNFKCNYQSILGRDRSINTYLSLSILSNMDKPFSGQGATRVHSSNLAAAAALKYLANYDQA